MQLTKGLNLSKIQEQALSKKENRCSVGAATQPGRKHKLNSRMTMQGHVVSAQTDGIDYTGGHGKQRALKGGRVRTVSGGVCAGC